MPRLLNVIGMGTLGLALTGCVSPEMYQASQMHGNELSEQVATLQTELAKKQAENQALQGSVGRSDNHDQSVNAQIASLREENEKLEAENAKVNGNYKRLVDSVGSLTATPLSPAVTQQLSDFASQNPETVEFNASTGVVKFKSDVSFATGDATVTAKVKEVLASFSKILDKAGTDQYDLRIEGHTDDTPITNPITIKNGNLDNWYLSAHRAIAVKQELVADGVASKRIAIVGYADKRPIASNGTAAGKAKNRRVEVVILPASAPPAIAPSAAMVDDTPRSPKTPTDAAQPAGIRIPPGASNLNK